MAENPKQYYISQPIFEGAQNAVIECGICDWHFAGPRPTLKEAWNEHYRMNHVQEVGIARIDRELRKSIWLPR